MHCLQQKAIEVIGVGSYEKINPSEMAVLRIISYSFEKEGIFGIIINGSGLFYWSDAVLKESE